MRFKVLARKSSTPDVPERPNPVAPVSKPPFTRSWMQAFTAITAAFPWPALTSHAAPPPCRTDIVWRLAAPPAAPLLDVADPSVVLAPLDRMRLATAGITATASVIVTPQGADLRITLRGPDTTQPALAAQARAIATTLPATIPATIDSDDHRSRQRTEAPEVTAVRAAMYMLHKSSAADLDPALALPRLGLMLQATPNITTTCTAPAPESFAPPTTASAPTLPPLLTAPALAPPRLVLLTPARITSADATIATTLASHPGAPLHRVLVSAPVRATAVTAHHLPEVGLLALVLDLPLHSDWRAVLHEAKRALRDIAIETVDVRGAALIAHQVADKAPTLARNLSKILGSEAGTWVLVAPSEPLEPDTSWLDETSRTRFVAASVELRCPAPSDRRLPEERLQSKLGLDAGSWRNLAREVAADRDIAAALERETIDRCEELKRLRQAVDIATWRTIRQAWACRIRVISDAAKRWQEEVRLMQLHGFDSAMLTPILGMVAGDPALERIASELDERCPPPGAVVHREAPH